MKKTKTLYLLAVTSLLTLASCSGGDGRGTSLAPLGEEVDLSETIKKIPTALKANILSSEGFSLKLGDGGSFNYEETKQEHHSDKASTDHKVVTTVDVATPSLDMRFSGFAGTSASEAKASVSLGASASISKQTDDGDKEAALPSATYSISAYLNNTNAYLNLSNGGLSKILDFVTENVITVPEGSSLEGYLTIAKLIASGKWMYSSLIDDETMPLISQDVIDEAQNSVDSFVLDIDTFDEFTHAKKESDGSYSVYASLNKSDVITVAKKAQEEADEDSGSSASSSVDYDKEFENLKISNLEFILNFSTETGINYAKSIINCSNEEKGVDMVERSYDSSLGQFVSNVIGTMDTKTVIKSELGISFGKEAPNIPSSFTGYTDISALIKSSVS